MPAMVWSDDQPATDTARGPAAVIRADSLQFDRPTQMATGIGNVVIEYKGARLVADKARFHSQTSEAWAEGHVRLNRANEEWVAPALYYNFDTRAVKISEMRGFADGFYLGATNLAQATTNFYTFARGTVTTCDAEHPHYRLQATRGEIWPGDRVVMYNVTVRVGDVPVFWMPMTVWSLSGDEPPLGVSVGHSSEHGYYVLTRTYWKFADQSKLTLHVDGRTARGPGMGADYYYQPGQDGYGWLSAYYTNDDHPMDEDDVADGKKTPHNRYRFQAQHRQTFDASLTLRADINKISDPDVVEDFFRDEFNSNREPQSMLEVAKTGSAYTLSLMARPQLNNFFAEVERLPEMRLSVNRTRLGATPVFYEGESSAGYYNNHPRAPYLAGDFTLPAMTGYTSRFDTFHQLLLPHTFWNWLAVVPRAGARYTWYERAPPFEERVRDVHREVFNLGVETSFKLSRAWEEIEFAPLGVNGLRHVIQPFANYQWVPTPNRLPGELYQFDTVRYVTLQGGDSLSLTRYLPLDFPVYNTVDAIERQNLVRFGVRQSLQTRRQKRTWDLIELEGWTDWRIEQNAGEHTFSDVFGLLTVRPAQWVGVSAFSRYNPHDDQWKEINTGINMGDPDRWSVGIGTRYIRNDSNIVALRVAGRLSRYWSVQMFQRMDMEDGHWEEQEYGLMQETHDWYINYGVRYRNQRAREDDLTLYVSVTLKAAPGVRVGLN